MRIPKVVWIIITVGLLLRLLLSTASFHPDVRAFDFGGQLVASGNISNFYDYIGALSPNDSLRDVYPPDYFIYPPAVYFYHGFFALLFNRFFSPEFLQGFLLDVSLVFGNLQLYTHLLLLKLPYLVFDLGIAALFYRLFSEKKQQYLALALWMFNPVSLHATYLMGQFDIIPTFFVVLSIWLATRPGERSANLYLAALSLGVGAAFKIYPLFLLIPLAALSPKLSERIKLLAIGLMPYLLTVGPYIFSAGFRRSALIAGQTQKSFFAQIPISGGEAIVLFPAVLLFVYLWFWSHRTQAQELWQRFFVVLLLFFVFTHYHPQWFIWLTPFMVFYLLQTGFQKILPVSLALGSFFGLLFFFDPSLTLGLFSPVKFDLYEGSSVWQLLGVQVDINYLRSLLQTVFAGCALYFIYEYFRGKDTRQN